MINAALAREIYATPWFIDQMSANALLSLVREGHSFSGVKTNNLFGVYETSTGSELVSDNFSLSKLVSKDNISLIRLDGAITKNGGESSYGTKDLSKKLLQFDFSDKIIGHILSIDSGGGSTNAVAVMTEAMQKVKKPIVVLVDGMMASAALYIGSYADYIYASRDTDTIGSVGTMIEFSGYPSQAENKSDGEKYIRVYASASTDKNKAFEEAINNNNYKLLQEDLLNPINERFMADVRANRPNTTDDMLTGKTYNASEVVGTFIDAIGSMEDAIAKVIELSKNNNQKNNKTMNIQELKAAHPETYGEVVSLGVIQERERVGQWLEFSSIDAEAVNEGITTGKVVDASVISAMSKKAIANATLKTIESENVATVNAVEEVSETVDVQEALAFENEVFSVLKLKK